MEEEKDLYFISCIYRIIDHYSDNEKDIKNKNGKGNVFVVFEKVFSDPKYKDLDNDKIEDLFLTKELPIKKMDGFTEGHFVYIGDDFTLENANSDKRAKRERLLNNMYRGRIIKKSSKK